MPEIFLGTLSIDTDPPVVSNRFPASGATEVAIASNVSFDLTDTETGVNTASVSVTLNGVPAITLGVFQPGFTGSFTPIANGYTVTINPSADFALHSIVTVVVNGADLNILPNYMAPDTWSFDTLDDNTAPTVINNTPNGLGPGNAGFPLESQIAFDIIDNGFNGVDLNSVVVVIEGTTVYQNSGQLAGYIVVVTPLGNGYHFNVTAPANWGPGQTVNITVTGQDTYAVPNVMAPFSWSFLSLLDNTPPHVEDNAPVGLYRPLNEHIRFDLIDTSLLGVDPASTVVRVDGNVVWQNQVAQGGFTVVVTSVSGGFHYDLAAPFDWIPGVSVTVSVDADDTVNTMPTFSWSFVGTTVGLEKCNPAPLLPVEERLRTPLVTPALEELRRAVLTRISRDSMLDHRIRGVLLTAHANDFGPVFADVLFVPDTILGEIICKRRKLFDLYRELVPYTPVMLRAIPELNAWGLSRGYLELIDARVRSTSPQQVVGAACAILLFGAVLQPPVA